MLEAPTGSGKSAYAAAVSSHTPVLVLTRTRSLQAQYAQEYGATVLYGRANYPCALASHLTAEDCQYPRSPRDCPVVDACQYLQARQQALQSRLTVLNYAYALSSQWLHEEEPRFVFLDEAHNLPDVTLDWAGCTIRERDVVEFGLPPLPLILHRSRNVLLRLPDPAEVAADYMRRCVALLCRFYPRPQMTERERNLHRRGLRLRLKVAATLAALQVSPEAWYIRSDTLSMQVRPLTARFHFRTLFPNSRPMVAMSATIGNPATLAEELGIDEYDIRIVPNRFSPEMRRIHVLDTPRMGHKASDRDFEHQADAIAAALKRHPHWSGLVLVTRKSEAILLARRLAARGVAERIFVTPGADGDCTPTDAQVHAWNTFRRKVPNAVCVTWAFWEGYNGLEERICIVAKVPFPYLGDDYERERMEYSRRMYLQRAAWLLEQGLGRTRRGREEDYGDENGFVAIADADWTRVKSFLSESTREAINVP